MRRSQINTAIRHAIRLLGENDLRLPGFAYWTPDEWKRELSRLGNLKSIGLGWDVTDFGSGEFSRCGSVLFTVRNGKKGAPELGTPYAEKMIFQLHETEQEIPLHFHIEKTEDIINRGGGILALQLYHATANGQLDEVRPVTVRKDGIETTVEAGSVVEIEKGGSITLFPRLFHRFWARRGAGDLVVGEISSVNDDLTDNVFLHSNPRFAVIEEDEPICFKLCNEYE